MTIQGVNDLDIGSKLGQGHFGEVFHGSVRPHGAVAIKRIDCNKMAVELGMSDWDDLREHLFAEADNLRKAEHSHVVRVHGVHYDAPKDYIYIVTELCDASLQSGIASGPLPLREVGRYARHALLGLEALHVRSLIHRDLKPGNILLKGDEAKLSDFGLVTDKFIAGYASHRGYIEHLAPEVFRNDRTSPRSDVWAMGMTLYRMLNGEPWYKEVQVGLGVDWTSPGADKVMEALITRGGFAQRLPWMPHVPDTWRRFVRKSMHDLTARRFQSGGAMLSAMTMAVEPSWACSVIGASATWNRSTSSGRFETVSLDEVTPGRFTYRAVSTPPAGRPGRTMTHLASKTPVSRQAALKSLQAFFATRT